jgi:large subunit ribosomal protein L15e
MGAYSYMRKSFQDSFKSRSEQLRQRISLWRKQRTIERIKRSSDLPRARALGYKAKRGVYLARVRIRRGKRARDKPDQGRKPGRNVKRVAPGRSLDYYAQEKAAHRFPNLKATHAYWVGEDGVFKYFEVILHDKKE